MSGQRSDWLERLHANPSQMEQELAIKLQDNGIYYQTQVEIPVTIADFYFSLEARPLIVFVDGRVHLGRVKQRRTRSYDHSYVREDIESWNSFTTATRTGEETSCTNKFSKTYEGNNRCPGPLGV